MKTAAGCVAYVLAVGSYSGWAFEYASSDTPGWAMGLIVASCFILWLAVPLVAIVRWMVA